MLKPVTIVVLCVALGACNAGSGSPPPTAGSFPLGSGPFGPASNAPAAASRPGISPIQHVEESRSQSVSPDGRTIRTESTRTSVSFDPERAVAALGALAGPQAASRGVAGQWRAQSSSSRVVCSVSLYGDEASSGGQAESSGCGFGGSLWGITGWRMAGGNLQLLKGQEVSLDLQPLGPGRFQAQQSLGILTTTISLYR
jgi:hypothetical protein